jgi:NAD(P)-dependent dehydrogenase (short-subunit alcohol dehydrogenase family)
VRRSVDRFEPDGPAQLVAAAQEALGPVDILDGVPVGRVGRPEEAADLALANLRNGYITNHVFSVDGGMHPR